MNTSYTGVIMKPMTGFKRLTVKYTLWFGVFAFFCIILFFIINGKSIYTIADGVYQQYPYFMYTGKWIRMLFSNLFIEHKFELPMWDMSIGMGSDSLITFSSVANPLADPMYWISAFIPYKYAEYTFDAIVILKMYASGLAFSYFCHTRKLPSPNIVAGAMVYVFSSVMYIGLTQASIINVFYLFPLLMAGVDRLWEGKGFKLYTLILALTVVNSYYFTYMMGLMVLMYCIIRFICTTPRQDSLPRLLGRFVLFTVIGLGIGIGLQLPAMINLSGLDRLSVKWDTVIFSFDVLKAYILYSFSITNIAHEGFWGVSPVALIALVLLFSEKKKDTLLKALFIVYTLSLFFPIIGSVFNGFTFPTGRFVFGYIFLVAFITASKYGNIFSLKKNTRLILVGASVLYLLITALLSDINGVISGVSCLIMTGMLSVISEMSGKENKKHTALMITVLITCVLLSYAHIQNYLIGTEMEFGKSYDYLLNSNGLDLFNDDEREALKNTRFDFLPYYIDDVPLNSSMLLDINSYDFYNSNYNNDVDRYYDKLAVNINSIGYMVNGIRGRNFLELMNGTSFVSVENKHDYTLLPPYSYEYVRSDEDYSVYRSASGTSMIWFYDDAVSSSSISNADPIDIEEIMMNYCVLDEVTSTSSLPPQHTDVDYEISLSDGIEQTGANTFSAHTGDSITLSFDSVSDSEISVYLDGIDADRYFVVSAVLESDGEPCVIDTIEGQTSINNMYYHNKDTFLINYGFVSQPVDSVRLVFLEGNYTLNDLRIYTRSADQLDAAMNAFYGHADMNNVTYELDGNHIHINADADQDNYLYLAVPYSDGWRAEVDGEQTDILKANIGFMAIPLTQGEHTVEFTYRTPYLITGLCISLFFFVVFLFLPDKLILLLGFRENSVVIKWYNG